jgi:hypothetical protein
VSCRRFQSQRPGSWGLSTPSQVVAELEPLDTAGQMQIFIALFYMFGTKVGAMKYSTGIE